MFTIGKLAQAGDVGVETVRYYQREGLLDIPAKQTGIRRYDQDDLQKLKFIRKAQAAGFTLREIKELISLSKQSDRTRVRALANQRVKALDEKIKELEVARNALEKLSKACLKNKKGPCPILDSFDS